MFREWRQLVLYVTYSKYTMVSVIVLTILDDIVVDKRTFKDSKL